MTEHSRKKMNAGTRLLRLFHAISCGLALAGLADPSLAAPSPAARSPVAQDPANAFSDPVLSLKHTQAQIALELAPSWMVQACNYLPFHHMWVFAQTSQPEGTYVLVDGSIWARKNIDQGQPPLDGLEKDTTGEIDLIRKDHSCSFMWNADDSFFGMFMGQPENSPTPAQARIIRDLGVNLIRREERIFGGREGFFKALAATGHGIEDQDNSMIPLLEAAQSAR